MTDSAATDGAAAPTIRPELWDRVKSFLSQLPSADSMSRSANSIDKEAQVGYLYRHDDDDDDDGRYPCHKAKTQSSSWLRVMNITAGILIPINGCVITGAIPGAGCGHQGECRGQSDLCSQCHRTCVW